MIRNGWEINKLVTLGIAYLIAMLHADDVLT